MIRRPPRSTRTDTLFPYTTLFRSSSFLRAAKNDSAMALSKQIPVRPTDCLMPSVVRVRSEEHTSELQSLMRISYAVFCLKKKTKLQHITFFRIHLLHIYYPTLVLNVPHIYHIHHLLFQSIYH